ncbi:MAG: hypothetical protein LUD15_01285 [Bacteroides sp.]|nr:hypothetical protein [Bacteroides sp.]
MKNFLLFYILILLNMDCLAHTTHQKLTDQYNFSNITIEDGLLHNYVDSIFKDSKGFLWFSTFGGLSRYDGYEFVHYTTSSEAVRLKSNFVRMVCEDEFHRLWIASEGGIDILDLQTNQLVNLPGVEIFRYEESSHLLKDQEGKLWIVTPNNLYSVTFTETGNIRNVAFLHTPHNPEAVTLSTISEINHEIWIGQNNQIFRVREKSPATLTAQTIFPENTFYAAAEIHHLLQKGNQVWIGTNLGLYCYSLTSKEIKQYQHTEHNPLSLTQSYITFLALTETEELIVATLKGLNFYDPFTDSFFRIVQDEYDTERSINCNFINCLFTDGNII